MTNASYDNSTAVVVLPAVAGGRLRDPELRRWLARSDLARSDVRASDFRRVLAETGDAMPDIGLGALRFWGQTGERPQRWMAAADPVCLEPGMSRLCLHAIRQGAISYAELGQLVDHLQQSLAGTGGIGFVRLGAFCYVTAGDAFATAVRPATEIDGLVPNEYLADGDGAASQRRLQSEIEMALHEHPVNQARVSARQLPVNSFWLWGGGIAPAPTTTSRVPLFTNDPLLKGFWLSQAGCAEDWPGSLRACMDDSAAGFVAVAPATDSDSGCDEAWLHELRDAQKARRLNRVILLFGDGLRAEIRRSHSLRWWRRRSILTAPGETSGS